MQEGFHSDITTHISQPLIPQVYSSRTKPAADEITGNGSQLQTVLRRISFTKKQIKLKHTNDSRSNQSNKGKSY